MKTGITVKTESQLHYYLSSKMLKANLGDMLIIRNTLIIIQLDLSTNNMTSWHVYCICMTQDSV